MFSHTLPHFLLGALALAVVGVGLASCSGSDEKKRPFAAGGAEAGAAGETAGGAGGAGGAVSAAAGATSAGTANAAGQAGTGETTAAGAGGVASQEAAGTGGLGGEAGSVCDSATTGGRILISFDSADAERVTNLQWVDSTAATTPNLIGQGGPAYCNDPVEFFGQSYGAPEGTLPDPVVAGGLATFVHCGLDATITSAATSCNPAATAQTPVTTLYHFYDDARDSEMRITRHIGFDASTPVYTTTGLRPFVPRVSLATLPTVIYPNAANTAVTTTPAGNCPSDCIIPTGTTWNGHWFADIDPTSGLALIVLRDATLTSAVSLTVNYDSYSSSNLASFVLLQPASGWKAPVTEIEYLCFADLTSWPQAQRDAAQLPAGCGP